jgi:hypothetical protein
MVWRSSSPHSRLSASRPLRSATRTRTRSCRFLAEMIKWEDPDGIDRLLRRRLATYETEALARIPMRAWPQKRAALEDMYSKGCMRTMEIQQRVFPATVISSQPVCNPDSFQLLGHDALELWSMWSHLGSAKPDLSSVQFFETVRTSTSNDQAFWCCRVPPMRWPTIHVPQVSPHRGRLSSQYVRVRQVPARRARYRVREGSHLTP